MVAKPDVLMDTALIRAKMCEMIARSERTANPESCFMVGLCSTLDAFFDAPLAEVLEQMPLADELNAALLRHTGTMGEILSTAIAYEQGTMDYKHLPLECAAQHSQTYTSSIRWANTVRSVLAA